METNVMVPGNSLSIARQFLRCCLHQLAPNGIFPMLFLSNFNGERLYNISPISVYISCCYWLIILYAHTPQILCWGFIRIVYVL